MERAGLIDILSEFVVAAVAFERWLLTGEHRDEAAVRGALRQLVTLYRLGSSLSLPTAAYPAECN